MLPRRKLKRNIRKQVGAELGKAQRKLGLGRIKIFLALAKSRKVVWDQTSPDHSPKKCQSSKVDAVKSFVPSKAMSVVS